MLCHTGALQPNDVIENEECHFIFAVQINLKDTIPSS